MPQNDFDFIYIPAVRYEIQQICTSKIFSQREQYRHILLLNVPLLSLTQRRKPDLVFVRFVSGQ